MSEPSAGQLEHIWRRRVAPVVFADCEPHDDPVMVLLGGQPGAGKTRATALITQEMYGPNQPLTAIVGDDYRRFHPDYRLVLREDPLRMPEVTAAAAGRWIQMSVDHALEHRFPILVEGTWRNASVPLGAARQAKEHGYRVHAVAVAVSPVASRLATLERFYHDVDAGQDARWTPSAAHDQAVAELPATTYQLGASPLVDRLTVLTRETEVLFDRSGAGAERGEQARAALRAGMDRYPAGERAVGYLAMVEQLEPLHRAHTLQEPDARRVWTQVLTNDVPAVRAADAARTARACFPDQPRPESSGRGDTAQTPREPGQSRGRHPGQEGQQL